MCPYIKFLRISQVPLKAGRADFYEFPGKRGFTLLETMVALAVLMAAIVGPVSLVTRGILDFSFAKNKTIAANLAQEGIELIRTVRDNNIMCDLLNGPAATWEWNRDPEGGLLASASREVAADAAVPITCSTIIINTPRLALYTGQTIKFNSSSGLYGYSGEDTLFTRRVDIKSPPDSPDAGITASDQMDVISSVRWMERGLAREMILRERLYNWK